jgi:hypothetical protein
MYKKMNEIYIKTKKGIAEIEQHTNELNLRIRRVLIQIDGRRSVKEINAVGLADDLGAVIAKLERDGFISCLEESDTGPVVARVEDGQPPKFTFRTIPTPRNPKDIEMAKNFMVNTIQNFCGPWAHISVVTAISAANTHEDLRKHFVPWFEAIDGTREGRRQAQELTTSLLKVI